VFSNELTFCPNKVKEHNFNIILDVATSLCQRHKKTVVLMEVKITCVFIQTKCTTRTLVGLHNLVFGVKSYENEFNSLWGTPTSLLYYRNTL
jgi:hypothetical protein